MKYEIVWNVSVRWIYIIMRGILNKSIKWNIIMIMITTTITIKYMFHITILAYRKSQWIEIDMTGKYIFWAYHFIHLFIYVFSPLLFPLCCISNIKYSHLIEIVYNPGQPYNEHLVHFWQSCHIYAEPVTAQAEWAHTVCIPTAFIGQG